MGWLILRSEKEKEKRKIQRIKAMKLKDIILQHQQQFA